MKNIIKSILILIVTTLIWSCQDNLLDTNIEPVNNNLPDLNSLKTVDGLTTYSRGIYRSIASNVAATNDSPMLWFVYGYHETMGDNLTMPWGNFGGRWINQPSSVTLDDGSVVLPPAGGAQPDEIAIRNSRAAGSDNATQYEWRDMYRIIVQSNTIIKATESLSISESENQAFNAWALWWKAYAYHRLGSIYEQGVINTNNLIDNPIPITSANFVSNTELINQSNLLLDQLNTVLSSVPDDGLFNSRLNNFQLSYIESKVNKSDLSENSNTLRARNLVYNTRVTDMTNSNWNDVITWCNSGVSNNSGAFIMQSETSFINNSWLPGQVTGFWYFPSDRLIQDINSGDNRLSRYFTSGFDFPNPRGRGIHYGASYFWQSSSPIVSGNEKEVSMYYAGSFEENQLFLAEAKVRTGDIEGGLSHLDAVRNLQDSGLAATVGTGLTNNQALEEIRKERRLALVMRAVAFYDSRRYGISSGSRTGARVLDTNGVVNTNATINYEYLDYWPVPAFEDDFNPVNPSRI